MVPLVRAARNSCERFLWPAGGMGGETTRVLVVLVLFVAGLLASGQNLVAAVAAAVVLSGATGYVTGRQVEG